MAFTDPGAVSTGDTGTSTWANNVRASLNASGVAVVTTKGDLTPATGSQAVARLAVGADDTILVPDASATTGLAWQTQPACRVYNDATIGSLVLDTWTSLTFNAETFDPDAMHSTVTNPARLTIPTGGAGIYLIGCSLYGYRTSNALGYSVRVLLNGTTVIAEGAGAEGYANLAFPWSLAAADYIELQYYTAQDAADGFIASGESRPAFWALWQRR